MFEAVALFELHSPVAGDVGFSCYQSVLTCDVNIFHFRVTCWLAHLKRLERKVIIMGLDVSEERAKITECFVVLFSFEI